MRHFVQCVNSFVVCGEFVNVHVAWLVHVCQIHAAPICSIGREFDVLFFVASTFARVQLWTAAAKTKQLHAFGLIVMAKELLAFKELYEAKSSSLWSFSGVA